MGEESNSPRAEQSLLLSVLTMETTLLHLNYAFVFGPIHQCSIIQEELFKYSEVKYLTYLLLHNLWEWQGSPLVLIPVNNIPTEHSDNCPPSTSMASVFNHGKGTTEAK